MATVPGTPIQDLTGGIPKELQPTQTDMLMAAAIMHQQGRMQLAGDVVPYGRGPAPATLEALGKAVGPDAKGFEGSDPSVVAKAAMKGKVKVLTPTPKSD